MLLFFNKSLVSLSDVSLVRNLKYLPQCMLSKSIMNEVLILLTVYKVIIFSTHSFQYFNFLRIVIRLNKFNGLFFFEILSPANNSSAAANTRCDDFPSTYG